MSVVDCEIPDLYQELWQLLSQVPSGRVTTYGSLAVALGDAAAARWIGGTLRDHAHTENCPCHRVVRQTGELGLYVSGDVTDKQDRLERESVRVEAGRVDLKQFGFDRLRSRAPLTELSQLQKRLPAQLSLEPYRATPQHVAGVDVSYTDANRAVGAYVVIDAGSGQTVWSTTAAQQVRFPYIPGYLAFRELPVLCALLHEAESAGRLTDVILVDGNGILHHRRAGIASQLGVVADVRTIGVGKKRLCGHVDIAAVAPDRPQPVVYEGDVVGMAIKATAGSRPIYVSPGQRIGVRDAVRLTRTLFYGHRLPEPLYQADALSRQTARSLLGP